MAGPLDGLKVLDCTSVVLGPLAGQQLGDLGADVIKVEAPGGDNTRQLGPRRNQNMSAFFLGCNRNKRSIVLDLKQADGREALFRMAKTADVIMHNLRDGPAKRLGISYDELSKINPRLIYLATYGFRADGPMGPRAAYDDIIQAGAGLTTLQLHEGEEPRFMPSVLCDKTTAATIVSSVLAALYERERSGLGQAIEVPMYETMVSFNMVEHLYGETFVPKLDSAGYKRIVNKERRPYPTKDGYYALQPYTDRHWQEFCKLIERPEIMEDVRFQTLPERLENIKMVYSMLAEICTTRTNAEWAKLLEDSNVPHGRVNTLEDLLVDEQLNATGYWSEVEHPTEGRLRVPGIAPRFSRTAPEVRRLQPNLGEHSIEVLEEGGYTAAEIEELLSSGATADGAISRKT